MLDFFHYTFGFRHQAFGIKIQFLASGRQASSDSLQDFEGSLQLRQTFKQGSGSPRSTVRLKPEA